MAGLFTDKSTKPGIEMLSKVLGPAAKHWESIRGTIEQRYGPLTEEWKYYSLASGWTLKVLRKKRNLFFFAPCEKHFRVAFIFGDKAVRAVETSNVPTALIRELKSARKYAEGRGVRIEVRSSRDVATVLTLVDIKINN